MAFDNSYSLQRSGSISAIAKSRSSIEQYRLVKSSSYSTLPTCSPYKTIPTWSIPRHYTYRDLNQNRLESRKFYNPIFTPYHGYQGKTYVSYNPTNLIYRNAYGIPSRQYYADQVQPCSKPRYSYPSQSRAALEKYATKGLMDYYVSDKYWFPSSFDRPTFVSKSYNIMPYSRFHYFMSV